MPGHRMKTPLRVITKPNIAFSQFQFDITIIITITIITTIISIIIVVIILAIIIITITLNEVRLSGLIGVILHSDI